MKYKRLSNNQDKVKEWLKSTVVLESHDEWWNGSNEDITLEDMDERWGISKQLSRAKQEGREEMIRKLEECYCKGPGWSTDMLDRLLSNTKTK